jgi:ComF family protein
VASSLTVKFKFSGKLGSLITLAALARLSPSLSQLSEPDIIIPVPLHKKRLQERGFNQALLIARECFPAWRDRLIVTGLLRHRPTAPQVSLCGRQRRKNLKGAFVANIDSNMIEGKIILIVDDVFTTGSTASECSRVLKRAGAAWVEVFTITRSLPSGYLSHKSIQMDII